MRRHRVPLTFGQARSHSGDYRLDGGTPYETRMLARPAKSMTETCPPLGHTGVDQCVSPPAGACSSVFTMTSSTWSSVIVRAAPGRAHRCNVSRSSSASTSSTFDRPDRGLSVNPSSRDSTKRRRHLPTVAAVTPKSAATCVLAASGSAHANTIRARNPSWESLRAQRTSTSPSTSDSVNPAFGRPLRATKKP